MEAEETSMRYGLQKVNLQAYTRRTWLSALCPRVVTRFIPSQWRGLGHRASGWASGILSNKYHACP